MEIKNEVKNNPIPQAPVKQLIPPVPVRQPLPAVPAKQPLPPVPAKPPVPEVKKNIQDPKDVVLLYLRDNIVHGNPRCVDMINRVLVKEGGI